MRWVYLLILVLVVGAIGVFALQNPETITLQYFDWRVACPPALLVAIVYLLGMVSGGAVVSLVLRSLRRVTERPAL